jgi:hypothetical protein
MPDGNAPPLNVLDADRLYQERRVTGFAPVKTRRPTGEAFDIAQLGRVYFSQMPQGRPSFWAGVIPQPDSRFALKIVCEVENDALPGPDHSACIAAIRRLQVQDAMLCTPHINERLASLRATHRVSADDLVVCAIHLSPHPLVDSRYELGFRDRNVPDVTFTVVFVRGAPHAVRIESDAV